MLSPHRRRYGPAACHLRIGRIRRNRRRSVPAVSWLPWLVSSRFRLYVRGDVGLREGLKEEILVRVSQQAHGPQVPAHEKQPVQRHIGKQPEVTGGTLAECQCNEERHQQTGQVEQRHAPDQVGEERWINQIQPDQVARKQDREDDLEQYDVGGGDEVAETGVPAPGPQQVLFWLQLKKGSSVSR